MGETSSTDEVRTFYNGIAGTYASMMDEEINLPMYPRVLSELASQIEHIDGPILDTSCGSGHMLEALGTTYARGRERIGIDLSSEMVDQAASRLGPSVSVSQGDMQVLDHIGESTCAAVISFFALHHVDLVAVGKCFREWHRVLKPGGRLLAATWEGRGRVDYGDQAEVVANRYSVSQLEDLLTDYTSYSSHIESFEGMESDAVIVSAVK